MITNVVFTGPAIDGAGNFIVRADLTLLCGSHGIDVQRAVRPDTHILVASRNDTVKAKRAAGRHKKVMTYPQFLSQFLPGVERPRSSAPSRYLDMTPTPLTPVPAKVGFAALDVA